MVLVNTSSAGGFAARYADTGELCEEATVAGTEVRITASIGISSSIPESSAMR